MLEINKWHVNQVFEIDICIRSSIMSFVYFLQQTWNKGKPNTLPLIVLVSLLKVYEELKVDNIEIDRTFVYNSSCANKD